MMSGDNLHFQPIMILALLPFAIGFESTRVATSVSLMRFTSLSTFIQVLQSYAEDFSHPVSPPRQSPLWRWVGL